MITSLSNKRVAKAVRLKKRAMREKDRRFLVEGARAVREAVATGAVVHELFMTPASASRLSWAPEPGSSAAVAARLVSEDVMHHLTSTVTPQGVVAVAEFVDLPLERIPEEARCVPVLVAVRDPGNAGTIVRSADAAGADGVVFTRTSVDVYNPKTVRASAGSMFHIPVVREVTAEQAVGELRRRGFAVLTAAPDGEASIYDVDLAAPTAVLFGNEAGGVAAETSALAEGTIRVPILGKAESLNVAAAATLVLFESARQRAAGASLVTGRSPPRDASVASGSSLASVVAAAAHDIRSPLAALRGFLSTLIRRWDRMTEDQRFAMIAAMEHDSARMAVLIAQLVDASRLAAGDLQLALQPTNVLEVAREVEADVSRWGAVRVVVRGERGDGVLVLCDPERLRTILIGMVESAAWWGQEGPVTIEVSGGPPVTVAVSRDASSVETGRAKRLLAPAAPGSGQGGKIGLFVAEGLARAQGGTLEADANGRFLLTLTLPPAPGP